jgi:hypothetical protein
VGLAVAGHWRSLPGRAVARRESSAGRGATCGLVGQAGACTLVSGPAGRGAGHGLRWLARGGAAG